MVTTEQNASVVNLFRLIKLDYLTVIIQKTPKSASDGVILNKKSTFCENHICQ